MGADCFAAATSICACSASIAVASQPQPDPALLQHVQAHFGKYEPTILELKKKYETAMKEKMLAGLERDKMAAKVGWPPAGSLAPCSNILYLGMQPHRVNAVNPGCSNSN